MAPADERDPDALVRLFLWWRFAKATSFRGYWLVTSLYLVVVADLSPFELVILGTAMEATVLLCEVPTGVMADTVSRKWSLVVSHVLMGAGMLATGLTTDMVALTAAQMLWGLGWTFSSGADIAWITDELDDDLRIDRVLSAQARWQQLGAASGNTVACRQRNAELASETGEPAAHCPAAGPGGDGICGPDCLGFCTLLAEYCTQLMSFTVAECVQACVDVPVLAEPYNVNIQSGDSLQCRLYHVSAASLDPATHCVHAAGIELCK